MSEIFFSVIKKMILAVALFSANSISQLGMYQLKCPKELNKKEL